MLKRFSVTIKGGIEVYAYEPENSSFYADPQLVSGFLEALQSFSEEMKDPIQHIKFFDSLIYIRTYENFTLRLVVNTKIDEKNIENYFKSLSKDVVVNLDLESRQIEDPDFTDRVKKHLEPLLPKSLQNTLDTLEPSKVLKKIGLMGLAQAGKTSIKRKFFDKWSKDQLSTIKPTIHVKYSQTTIDFLKETLQILDFGGQLAYRNRYLNRPSQLIDLTSLIFMVDIQNTKSIETASSYLDSIWKILKKETKKMPRLSIFFNKYDKEKRPILDKNLHLCIKHFQKFLMDSTFYLTTIEDNSSNLAMLKVLYFSLPIMMLKHQLQDLLIENLEKIVIKQLKTSTELEKLKESELMRIGKFLGRELSDKFQRIWQQSLTGEWSLKEKTISSKSLAIQLKEQSFLITVENWEKEDVPSRITDPIISGLLEGIMSSLYLSSPNLVNKEKFRTTWEILL